MGLQADLAINPEDRVSDVMSTPERKFEKLARMMKAVAIADREEITLGRAWHERAEIEPLEMSWFEFAAAFRRGLEIARHGPSSIHGR